MVRSRFVAPFLAVAALPGAPPARAADWETLAIVNASQATLGVAGQRRAGISDAQALQAPELLTDRERQAIAAEQRGPAALRTALLEPGQGLAWDPGEAADPRDCLQLSLADRAGHVAQVRLWLVQAWFPEDPDGAWHEVRTCDGAPVCLRLRNLGAKAFEVRISRFAEPEPASPWNSPAPRQEDGDWTPERPASPPLAPAEDLRRISPLRLEASAAEAGWPVTVWLPEDGSLAGAGGPDLPAPDAADKDLPRILAAEAPAAAKAAGRDADAAAAGGDPQGLAW